jgi:hypothetical protein
MPTGCAVGWQRPIMVDVSMFPAAKLSLPLGHFAYFISE